MKETNLVIKIPDYEITVFMGMESRMPPVDFQKRVQELVNSPKYTNMIGEIMIKAKEQVENDIARKK